VGVLDVGFLKEHKDLKQQQQYKVYFQKKSSGYSKMKKKGIWGNFLIVLEITFGNEP